MLETQGWLADDALIYVESEVENGLPPVPANWALYREKVALVFMALMHGMQLALLKSTIPKEGPQMTTGEKIRIFLFGVFELLVWQKKFKNKK